VFVAIDGFVATGQSCRAKTPEWSQKPKKSAQILEVSQMSPATPLSHNSCFWIWGRVDLTATFSTERG